VTLPDLGGLRRVCAGNLLTDEAELFSYSCDAASGRARPDVVVLAASAAEVQGAVRWCAEHKVPYVARGAGTNLSGGCIPLRGGVVISLARLDRILVVDTKRNVAVVEPGVVNLRLQEALAEVGRFYAPDPASYRVCTIGGNVAENAGGPRCLKYGVTSDHVRAVEAVMPDGTLERFSAEDAGCDFLSLLVGSEGTLGIAVKVWLDILPLPETLATALAAFPSLDAAMGCVSDVIAAGVLPRALEAMDRATIDTIEASAPAGYPRAEAVLLFELEGSPTAVERDLGKLRALCAARGATDLRLATDAAQSDKLWEGRRSAYAALSRTAPSVSVEDGVVPRQALTAAAARIRSIAAEHGLKPHLLFHAGDGNLHPNIPYDSRDPEQCERVRRASHDMLKAYVELGGSISGEHGIGVEKRPAMLWLHEPPALELMRRVKRAIDPDGLANPGKILPLPEDGSADGVPALRRRPPSDAQWSLIERVREKAGAKEPLFVVGTRTKLPAEMAEDKGEFLTTRPMSRVLDFDRANFTVTVEAGILLRELKAELEPEGFYVPLPLMPGTLGGLLAVRPWPGIRRSILGLRILLADGSFMDLGGKVVKNVAGYDLQRALLGSWGTLAVILEATLKLSPVRPEIPNELPKPELPQFGRWHRKLKEAFDPDGRLNRWR